MIALEVGKPHPLAHELKDKEVAIFDCFYCPATFTIAMPDIQDDEIKAIRKGKVHCLAVEYNLVLMITLAIENLSFEAPFNINFAKHPVDFSEYELTSAQDGFLLTIILVESNTGIIKVLRTITMPHEVSKIIYAAASRQYLNKSNFSAIEFDNELKQRFSE